MGRPITLNVIEDLAPNSQRNDILSEENAALLREPSVVIVYMNRESVDVTAQIVIGTDEVMALSASVIQAAAGVPPVLPDNKVVISMGKAGERVSVLGTNVNVAAQELRAIVMIFALSDVLRVPALLANS